METLACLLPLQLLQQEKDHQFHVIANEYNRNISYFTNGSELEVRDCKMNSYISNQPIFQDQIICFTIILTICDLWKPISTT